MGLEEAVLALRAIRKSKIKKKDEDFRQSLRKSLPPVFVNALTFAQQLSPTSTPTRRIAAETIHGVSFDDGGDICEHCHQPRPATTASDGAIHDYLHKTSRGITTAFQGIF